MTPNALKTALYTKLAGDSTLTTALGGTAIYEDPAPQGSQCPYVVFAKQFGRPTNTLGNGQGWEEDLFMVKTVCDDGPTSARAGTIAARIDSLLHHGTLTISGAAQLLCRRETDIDYPEPHEGRTFRHLGAVYRIHAQ